MFSHCLATDCVISTMTKLHFASFITNGLNNPVKRTACLDLLHRHKVDVAFVQESHLSRNDVSRFSNLLCGGFMLLYIQNKGFPVGTEAYFIINHFIKLWGWGWPCLLHQNNSYRKKGSICIHLCTKCFWFWIFYSIDRSFIQHPGVFSNTGSRYECCC